MTTLRRQPLRNVVLRSPDQLHDCFRKAATGSRPKRLGCEFEWLTADHRGQAVPFDAPHGASALLQRLEKHFHWDPVDVDGHALAVRKGEVIIGLEPGGQVEYSSAPYASLLSLFDEYTTVKADLLEAKRGIDLFFLSVGVHPTLRRSNNLPIVPKSRYRALADHLTRTGRLGHWMMKATASIQVNLDYADEVEGSDILRAAAHLSRWSAGMFSNSPIWKGRFTQMSSFRSGIWRDTDPARCGLPAFMLNSAHGLRDYVEYALDVPVIFCDWCPPRTHRHTFREWIQTGRPHRPTLGDWDLHLTSLYPDVRVKPQIELRFIDALPDPLGIATVAFFKGLLYSPRIRNRLLNFADRPGSRRMRPQELLELARGGMMELAPAEAALLEPLEPVVRGGVDSPARRTLAEWRSAGSPSEFVLRSAW
ncbi:MAG: hypothetical protein HYT87_08355 [Nitrospirae bacterium]|nr:hypothetical protein [Nitrospirota bacterium]